MSGGLLVVAADVGELCHHFRTNSILEVRERFQNMEVHDIPDNPSVPSMTVGYIRSGDYLYLPMSSMVLTKTINGDAYGLRS